MALHWRRAGFAVLIALGVGLAWNGAEAATDRTDWSLTSTFRSTGNVCALKFSAIKGDPTLSMTITADPREQNPDARFTLGGLPPYLEGKKGVIRDLRLTIDSLVFSGIKANWARGTKDDNSRITFPLPSETLLPALAASKALAIEFELANGVRSFTLELTGSAAPVKALAACLGQ